MTKETVYGLKKGRYLWTGGVKNICPSRVTSRNDFFCMDTYEKAEDQLRMFRTLFRMLKGYKVVEVTIKAKEESK